jgi:hypothetical protein
VALVTRLAALLVACALAVLGAAGVARADAPALHASEAQLKAAFVFKFGGYVEWPAGSFESARSPLVIGVFGAPELARELSRTASGRTVEGHPVQVRDLRREDSLAGVHVLYVGHGQREPAAAMLAASRGLPTLTVSDAPADSTAAMITLVVEEERVRFDIALAPAEASGLRISSRLLAVARSVQAAKP